MRKGFIYSIQKAPFSYLKSDVAKEFEKLTKEVHGIDIILSDRESFIFEMGYKFGIIDGECV